MNPSVTVITPVYNSEKHLRETIDSVVNQTYRNWELILVNDKSEDKSLNIIEEYVSGDERIKVINLPYNSGAAIARTKGISHSRSEFIAFLDSDDLWYPTKLEQQIYFMKSHINFSTTSYKQFYDENNILNGVVDDHNSTIFKYEDLLAKKITIGCCTVMIRKDSFKDLTLPNIRTGQDYAFWLKLCRENDEKVYHLNEPLSLYRLVEGSISSNKFNKAIRQWSIYRDFEGISFSTSLYYFFLYAFRAVITNHSRILRKILTPSREKI